MNQNVKCPYCQQALDALGFIEDIDALGIYVAETFVCGRCGYRLERHPVYVDDLPNTTLCQKEHWQDN